MTAARTFDAILDDLAETIEMRRILTVEGASDKYLDLIDAVRVHDRQSFRDSEMDRLDGEITDLLQEALVSSGEWPALVGVS